MFALLASTVVTSAADSINPIAITEQFVLQGMTKKSRDIWYFIVAIGLTNFLGGLLAYFGLISTISEFMGSVIEKFGTTFYIAEFLIGIIFIFSTLFLVYKCLSKKSKIQESSDEEEKGILKKIKNVTPSSLVVLGVIATISELTTALPYFAFLTILFNYKLQFMQVLFILIVYNIIYSMPLIVMYFLYVKAQDKFEGIYKLIKEKMNKWAAIIAPSVTAIIGFVLISHASIIISF